MYVCTICGFKKSELGSNPEFEFRRRVNPNEDTHLEGISDWCDKCAALRFFFKSSVDKDPMQALEEQQPTKKLASHALAASAKRQQNERQAKANREPTTRRPPNWERDVLKQELLASLPAQLPRGSMWERQLRSASADRLARRRQRVNPLLVQRSRSMVNDVSPRRLQVPKQLTELRGKKADLALPAAQDAKGQHNALDERTQDRDRDLRGAKTPMALPFNKDQLPSWQEEVQKQVNQLMAKRLTKTKTEVNSSRPYDSILAPIERLTKYELISKMQELQQDDLKSKLKEKRHQMNEWKRIRRHVDGEYDRIREELDVLKFQADLSSERKCNDPPSGSDRMKGGANFIPTHTSEEEKTAALTEKTIGDALDEKIALMLDTLHEQKLQSAVERKPSSKPHMDATQPPADQLNEASKQQKIDKLDVLVSTVQRATFRGFAHDPQDLLSSLDKAQLLSPREPPLPQFQTLPCPRKELVQLMQIKREVVQPHHIRPLKICRVPIYCPDSNCRRMFFISDFNEHLTHEHPSLVMERVAPGQVKTFFMNTCATPLGKSTCNMVYFVREKFFDKNTTKYPDLVPILVMSARFRITEFFTSGFDSEPQLLPAQHCGPDNEVFLIWLTAVRPDDAQIMATISVWPASKEPVAEYLIVSTNEVYDIRCTQKLKNLYASNRILMLSGNAINRMTNAGNTFLAVQVLIH
ncbi:hypothetical protein KR093_004365 [Drosophila rubida]|uniref:DUF4729 domain-containing protein n=1 Tax=Drosophila rubida TaxID=30044 RepID=A0AAD4JW80_9MUSC|nr:hypothetical protein KR093_004365 [Drosophila rubida]